MAECDDDDDDDGGGLCEEECALRADERACGVDVGMLRLRGCLSCAYGAVEGDALVGVGVLGVLGAGVRKEGWG